MSSIEEDFKKAAQQARSLNDGPSSQEKLDLYANYKQVTEGDVTGAQPWSVQMEARAKWDAWNALKGTSKEDAMKKYIELVNEAIKTYGLRAA